MGDLGPRKRLLQKHQVTRVGRVRFQIGILGLYRLPGLLRKRVRPTGDRQCSPPLMFGFVKSKCFSDDGVRKCLKAGHSCVRRVLDMSSIPNARGWKTVARAIRGTVAEAGLGKEVFRAARYCSPAAGESGSTAAGGSGRSMDRRIGLSLLW